MPGVNPAYGGFKRPDMTPGMRASRMEKGRGGGGGGAKPEPEPEVKPEVVQRLLAGWSRVYKETPGGRTNVRADEGRGNDATPGERQRRTSELTPPESGAASVRHRAVPPGWTTSIAAGGGSGSDIAPGEKQGRDPTSPEPGAGVSMQKPMAPGEPRPRRRTRMLHSLTGLLCCSVYVSFHRSNN
ncbi:hypothetical protein BD779DRAFT_564046 [Infundibulicybe gibba]|nr:hypothetical protein BD779DRAFT_564046 [Infundibulicybe gibba]